MGFWKRTLHLVVQGKVVHEVHMTGAGGTNDERLSAVERVLNELKTIQEEFMAKIDLAREALQQLNATTNQLSEAVGSVVAADQAEDDAFRAEIQALKDQIAAGEAVTEAQLDELTEGMGGTNATLTAVRDALAAMGTNPSEPIPPVDIPPVEPPVEG